MADGFLTSGTDVNEVDYYGNTSLYYAALASAEGMVAALLERGASDDAHRRCWWISTNSAVNNSWMLRSLQAPLAA